MQKFLIPLLFIILMGGCEDDPVNSALLEENIIQIGGAWHLDKVYQNEIDITADFDFSTFNLVLNYIGDLPATYSISTEHDVPFATAFSDGNWAFDNPVFPSYLHFFLGDTTSSRLARPLYPSGNTQLVMEFDLGCAENIYVYYFIKNE